MEIIGIICEYNPFHNGHSYHINKIKDLYPNSLIILVLNGYFLQRGEVSILSKEDKVKIALDNNVDLVIEHPFVYASNSADIFAESAVAILNQMGAQKLIFGSESNDIDYLTKSAQEQLNDKFNDKVKEYLKIGVNYPTALNKSLSTKLNSPNDLLGVAYIKAILKNNYKIKPITIKRTNDYHDLLSTNEVISASNIREKINNNLNVDKYTSYAHLIKGIDNDLLFNLLKYKIITDHNLNKYLSVDEGIEYKLIKEINNSVNTDELITNVKSKRYTYNRIRRMLIHILIGLTKDSKDSKDDLKFDYIKVLGFNERGQKYLNKIRKDIKTIKKIDTNNLIQKYELKASLIYDLLTSSNTYQFEIKNIPIKK
ncbi:MAG: nucleotidyltransferase [Bacilli bacterium]|nr:nucleotidyltransferase [Bacilli bacterium]